MTGKPDPLAEFRQPDRPTAAVQHRQQWPAQLLLGDRTAQVVTEPAITDQAATEPTGDDLDMIFDAWGLDRDQWEIDGSTVRVNAWPATIGPGETVTFRQFKATLRRVGDRADIAPILDGIRRLRPRTRPAAPAGGRTRVVAFADPQVGKAGTDGAIGIRDRWMHAISSVIADERKHRKLDYGTDTLVVALMGDLIENCMSGHDSQLYELDLHLTDQIRLVQELIWETVRAFAPMWGTVHVAAVPGNHGEVRSRRGGGMVTAPSDNFDVLIPDMVRRQIEQMNPEPFAHVQWWMPRGEELVVVLPLGDCTLGMIHGHQTRGSGDPLLRATKWWADNLVNDRDSELGAVDVLLVGHHHHHRVQRSGTRTLILCPSLEDGDGSRWWANRTGALSPPGVLTFTVDPGRTWPVQVLTVY